jgi:Ni/Fe-hydrogenase subunit HybB-like protein
MVTVESLLSARFLHRDAHMELMGTAAKATATVLLIYAAIKIADVTVRSGWSALTPFDWSDLAWLLEMALVVLLPAALLLIPSVRRSPGKLLAVQSLVVIGVVANRLNLAVASLVAANGGSYFPAPMEFAVSVALVTAGVLAFALAAKHLPVFAVHKETPHP